MEKNPKIYFFKFAIIFSIFFLNGSENFANNDSSRINIYIKKSKDINSKKRTLQISSSKSDSNEIKYFLKNNSKKQSRKGKNSAAVNRMLDSGVATKKMVKKNRWFVKKPFQKSYNKISKIKRVSPQKIETETDKNISITASDISRTRAQETGYKKPEEIFSGDSSRKAKLMTKTHSISAGPAKTGPVYLESSSRIVVEISNTRARETGSVKPQTIYSDQIGRDAFRMNSEKNEKKIIIEKNSSIQQRYSVDFLRSLSRKYTKVNENSDKKYSKIK